MVAELLPDVPRLFAWRIAKYGVVFGAAGTGTTLGAQLALLQTWVPWPGALNPPSWSVATECSFYLAFPFCLPFIARIRGVGRNVLLLAALVSVGIAIAFAAVDTGQVGLLKVGDVGGTMSH